MSQEGWKFLHRGEAFLASSAFSFAGDYSHADGFQHANGDLLLLHNFSQKMENIFSENFAAETRWKFLVAMGNLELSLQLFDVKGTSWQKWPLMGRVSEIPSDYGVQMSRISRDTPGGLNKWWWKAGPKVDFGRRLLWRQPDVRVVITPPTWAPKVKRFSRCCRRSGRHVIS
ncbi:hypothetical protein CEXT_314171 [Caerostris extrusa]|uniref:Uncharacterized protein n=1 Tax=Caerostris extrusa TaxID=172846 RepID=A0AAV4WCG2_CAEEX|nr:hypothetical protein CEXT_314171 [Caerostris extrusa]